jgi:type II secretory pathway pseudopilin PulG
MSRRRSHIGGMTVLEIMIVLAIIGGGAVLVRSGFRMITKADLVENATELAAVLRRTNQLAIEHGEMHRVILDLEDHQYIVEVCQGQTAIVRNEKLDKKPEDVKDAIERGKQRLGQMPEDAFAAGDPDEATKRAVALAGHHIADRTCMPAKDDISGDATGKGWARKLYSGKGIKFKEVWVQHLDTGSTKGKVAIYFFPMGSAEKAVIEVTDGSETFTVLVYGLTGRVELRDGELKSVDEHMLRNAMGDRDEKRDAEGEK